MEPLPINDALFILKVEVQVRVSHVLGDKGKTRFFQIFADSKSRVIEGIKSGIDLILQFSCTYRVHWGLGTFNAGLITDGHVVISTDKHSG
ncbi:hypothetical protein J3E68DRAFT_331186 [Trichoderma sp. SZMC 28012]